MGLVSLTILRMYRRPVGLIAFFNQKSPSPRRRQSPDIRNDFLEEGVCCALGALQDAKGKIHAPNVALDDGTNDILDLAHLYPFFLLFLLRRHHGHLPLVALLRASTSSVVAPCP
jgi:hypothetical protein